MQRIVQIFFGASMLSLAFTIAAVAAEKPIVYPAKGQSSATQSKDDGECYAWAKQSTGIDPAVASQSPPLQQTGPAAGSGERVKGAARGAAGGAAIGAITGDSESAERGAEVGAVAGTMAGGRRERAKQAEQSKQAQTQPQGGIETYYRAYEACMTGRGYTVK